MKTEVKSVFSFQALLDFWQAQKGAEAWLKLLDLPAPEDRAGWVNYLQTHADAPSVRLFFSAVIPTAFWESEISALVPPFEMDPVLATPRFLSLMRHKRPQDKADSVEMFFCFAWSFALSKLYQRPELLSSVHPILSLIDPESGFTQHFQLSMKTDFLWVNALKPLKVLDEQQWAQLKADPNNRELLSQMLPPGSFEFRGFVFLTAQDITATRQVSQLKEALLLPSAITSNLGLSQVETLLSSWLEQKNLKLNIAGIHENKVTIMHSVELSQADCWLQDQREFVTQDFTGSLFEKAYVEKKMLWVEDVSKLPSPSELEVHMQNKGVRSLLVAPLIFEDQVLGTFGLTSAQPGALGASQAEKLQEVLPLFALALHASLEDLENRIQRIIQERYTAIHPSVAWKFRQEALKLLKEQANCGVAEPNLTFDGVYPLYAATDIRNSSVTRNNAIATDLELHLKLALKVLQEARQVKDFPVFQELQFQVERYLKHLDNGLSSGDEIGILHFLRDDVEASFIDLKHWSSGVDQALREYQDSLDPQGRFVYRKRKDFDDSVARINSELSRLLETEQVWAQAMFPHYFDKTSTDGVDFNMYIGASLSQHHQFDRLYLRNLRLWQFILLCKAARLSHTLAPQLPLPLETTHLIVVQDLPITIRFREDEKSFSVEGAYNTRYEIMKKRIDKAVIKGSGERLTQIHQIALVYTQPSEALEYRRYIVFLQSEGLLEDAVEEFELDDLQGIHGLHALRVKVRLDGDHDTAKLVERLQENA